MIGYITVGTDKLSKSAAFYDELLKILGAARVMDEKDYIAWGNSENGPMFSIHLPANGKPATVGNGVMVAFAAAGPDQVAEIYRKALALGGSSEGEPGPRGDSGFYAAYFRDLDGNKFNVFCMVSK